MEQICGDRMDLIRPCERGREDEDDGEQRVNDVFYFSILIRIINDLVTNL